MIEIEKSLRVIALNNGYSGREFTNFLGLTFYRTNDLHIALDKKQSQAYILEVSQDDCAPLADRKSIVITECHNEEDNFMRYDVYADRKYDKRKATIEFSENGDIRVEEFSGFRRTYMLNFKNNEVQFVACKENGDLLESHDVELASTDAIVNALRANLIRSFAVHNDKPLEAYIDDDYIGEMFEIIRPAMVLHVLEFNKKCAERVSEAKKAVCKAAISAKSEQNAEELRNLQDFYEELEDAETWYSELEKAEYQTPTKSTR